MKLPRFGVEEWLNVHENSAIYDIAGVSISALTLEELFDLSGTNPEDFYKKLQSTRLNYGWIEGSPAFKKSVSQLYTGVKPEQILQTNGATGANLLVLYSLIEPGDHVISLYPTYQQLYDIPKSLGAEVDLWQIEEENGWLPDLEKLRQLIRPNTKMICINNANNPTGAVMDRAYLEELAEIADEVGAYILSDEVYRSFSGLDVPSIIDVYDKGIAVNSLSKTYSLPGIRVGWVAANHQVTDILRDYRDYTMICAGVFDDMVAQLALASRKEILKRNRRILEENLAILDQWIEEEPLVSYIRPAVVSTSFVKIAVEMPMEEFCLQLLQEYGVLLVPGNRFEREGYVRLGYACEQETLIKGLEKLSQFLRRFDNKN
ncbi:TPA: aminotransferase [Streptococcus suis]|uniref:aminotransferase n=1 Tax=Streptococcus suis TaxID=1307 RepID=UPI0003F79757|nr:aminotransferase [Streptococcus suis]MBY4962314.1 aminotransferase [Streptococcus suis]MBY4968648.1 aminotransferase [Streptococcus suis]MBY4979772.1 aminotransferase [Streptococcus suis]MBY4988306.1 aminotransferase [Streptococcus suis]MBY4994887.1 aminotransferase [Streptococcus suis]